MIGLRNSVDAPRHQSITEIPDTQVLREWFLCSPEQLLEHHRAIPEDDHRQRFARHYLRSLADMHQGDNETARRGFIRLLRITPRSHRAQYRIRLHLANILLRLGNSDRAERLIRRSMSLATFAELEEHAKGSFRSDLGRAYRRKGWLSMAAELYRTALDVSQPGGWNWLGSCSSLMFAELHANRLEQALSVLNDLEAQDTRVNSAQSRWIATCCRLSYCIDMRELRESVLHLERLRGLSFIETERSQLLFQNYEGDVLVILGRYAESVEVFRSALASPASRRSPHDLEPCLLRGMAESLHGIGDHSLAIEYANRAIHAVSHGDRLEELIALRIRGQCQWALGREVEARATFLRAKAVHVGREFVREERRLAEVLDRLGIEPLGDRRATSIAGPQTALAVAEPVELRLRDGLLYVTLDRELERQIQASAESELPVLIEGETGTGKELIGRLIHERGPRSSGPFVVVDCSTLPETLMESELFGAVRGAFTGCAETRDGIVARANGGTLFLDELPELSLAAQAKLLRLLQERTYRRVGEAQVRHVDVRFIATTNRPTAEMLENRKLKPDLYYRLKGHSIHLRPLRERRQEIAPIARRLASRFGLSGIAPDALGLLEQADWDGNVRELEMVLRSAAQAVPPSEPLTASGISAYLPTTNGRGQATSLRSTRLQAERLMLQEALDSHAGNVSAAARSLGISRQAFYKALHRTGVRAPA